MAFGGGSSGALRAMKSDSEIRAAATTGTGTALSQSHSGSGSVSTVLSGASSDAPQAFETEAHGDTLGGDSQWL